MSKPNQSTSASAIAKQVLKHTPQLPELPPKRTTSAIESAAATRPKGTQPVRSTKTSQKLVLFPPRSVEPNIPLHGKSPFAGAAGADDEYREREHDQVAYETERWRTEDHHHHQQRQHVIPQPSEWPFVDRTAAEHMTQDERDMANLPRVAAYCTGEGYQLDRLKTFLRQHHHVTPRLYDECLYAAYHYPLLTLRPGKENLFNVRVRSSSPRPQSISDNEELDIDEDTYQQDDAKVPSMSSSQKRRPYSRRASHGNIREEVGQQEQQQQQQQQERYYDGEEENEADHQSRRASAPSMGPFRTGFDTDIMVADKQDNVANGHQELEAPQPNEYYETLSAPTTPLADTNTMPPAPPAPMTPREDKESPSAHRPPFMGGEVFIFDYGVVVFWNFQRAQELLMLEDLAEFSIAPFRDNPDEDMQIEEMHFQYDTSQVKPRIFNDMITLKTHNHMIKLTISHGLSQSAVLARYEDIMDKTIEDTKHLPKEMAETGRLDKNRVEITKINGQLFNLRMNVNLVSNVLDTPEIFWSEPALQPLYVAIRDYLEIPQRAKILNDRLKVISDLLSMLRDHLTNFGVEYQTLIIIYLIIIAVIVACFEIGVKILQSIKVI